MRRIRMILWAVALVALGFSGWKFVPDVLQGQRPSELIVVGGGFAMTDHNGKAVTEKDYAGKAKAMFFGFTYCPDICPTTMARMANLMQLLGTDADKLQVIMVSVDSERDTPSILKPYVAAFDTRFVGLTGTPEQLAAFAKGYRFFYKKSFNIEWGLHHGSFRKGLSL